VASAILGPAALSMPPHLARASFATLAGLATALELLRLASPRIGRLVAAVAGSAFRPSESRAPSGATALAWGYFAAWALFEPRFAAAAVVVSGLADPSAAWVGRRFGRGQGKTLAGSVACAVMGWLGLVAFGFSTSAVLAGGLVAALVERVPWRGADNLLVPLAVGGALTLLGAR
jgi:dolichol kinase